MNPNDYDCVILDEAHEALGEETRKAVEQFTTGIKIGFTATPDFSEEKGVKDLLETEIHQMSLREGVESGHLSSFANVVVRTEADISKVKHVGDELDEKELAEAVDIESRNLIAVRIYQERFNGELAVAYCVGVRHAHNLAKLFGKAGVAAEAIDGTMDDDERKAILGRYARRETQVLCNADLLITGFDEPKASVCFNLRPTKSGVIAEQRGGRVMRLDPNNPDKLAYIIDLIDKGTDESGIVLFAKVADGSYIANPDSRWGKGGKTGSGGDVPPEFEIEGLDVVFDEEEIMRVQRGLEVSEKERIIGRTTASALGELEAAHLVWKMLPTETRGKFNRKWLWENGYLGLYQWALKHGGIDSIVVMASFELQMDFQKQKKTIGRTLESATRELEAAYLVWKGQDLKTRGKFNSSWLIGNGYNHLYHWAHKREGIDSLVAKASPALQADFDKQERTAGRTPESALAELETAYLVWRRLPLAKGRFSVQWLLNNSYSGLYQWVLKHGGIDSLVAKASPALQADFDKQALVERTPQSALAELETAHLAWKALPAAIRGKFNSYWLEKNGYSGLYFWTRKNESIEILVSRSSSALQADFEKQTTGRTLQSALAELEAAYLVWKKQPPAIRGKFNTSWLRTSGYKKLDDWIRKNEGIVSFVARASAELRANFEKREVHSERTPEFALAELEAAYLKWRALPTSVRKNFHSTWLRKNGYAGLDSWIKEHGGIESLLARTSFELQADFKI